MNGDYAITTSEDGDVGLRYDNSQKLVTTSSGVNITGGLNTTSNVGIGTTAPAHNLEIVATAAGSVNDSLQIRNNATSSGTGSRIRFINSTDNTSDTNGASISSVRNGDDNDLVFETENATRMTIDHAGNVGISNTAPDFNLSVGNSSSVNSSIQIMSATNSNAQLLFGDGAGAAGYRGTVVYGNATDSMSFSTAGSERMRLDSSGNLLIGKTADNVATVGIEARATGPLISTRDGSDTLRLNRLNSDGEIIQLRKDGTVVGSIGTYGGDLAIGTNNVGLRFIDSSDANALRIAPSNIGSNTDVDDSIDLGYASRRFRHGFFSNTVYASSFAGVGDTDTYINFANNNIMQFITNGSERARFDNGGNVFVGKTSDSQAGIGLSLSGSGFIRAVRNEISGVFHRTDSDGSVILFERNSNGVGTIGVTTSATTYNTSSDIRLKQDIEPLEATDKLMAMNPVSYNWKADPDGQRSMGFIAQEMQEVMPEAVSTGDDDMMAMDYGRITPILVSALQDAHRKIDELAAEIAELKAS